jgi:TRAP-type C4-dicarboxylate transport system substrate-binding protein
VIDFAKVPVGTLDVPLATGADLAGIYTDFATAQRAVARFMPALDPYVQQQGLKIVGNLSFSGDVFYCRVPVKSAKDLKGLRVRVSGTTQLDLIQGLGATQVTIDFAEVYAALQQGVIDCAVTDRASGNAQKWYEAARYLYTLQVVLAVGTYSANLKMWQALPRDVQDFLLSVFAEVTDKQWALAPQLAQAGTACNAGRAATCPSDLGVVASPPMNVTEPSAEDLQLVKQILNDTVIPNWLKRCGAGAVTTEQCRSIFNGTIGPEVGITLK